MQNKYRSAILFFVIPCSLFLMAWGHTGHFKISYNASLSFTPEMEQFMSWANILAEHASDADDRKATDPDESPRHYIDIDNYPGFAASGRIPQTYDSVVALYGVSFVIGQGILPWATLRTYDSLVQCFIRFDWEKAIFYASDLGHYVADGHMPLHITRNYDGQYTGNNGIHSRYESTMINIYNGQINYEGDDIFMIPDVNSYIFNYLYTNYTFVDSVLAADNYAKALAGSTSSTLYKQALWAESISFTIPLFSNASHALAELIYTAWVEAGKPDMNSGPGIFERNKKEKMLELNICPNPVKGSANMRFNLPEHADVKMRISDVNGSLIKTLCKNEMPAGKQDFTFDLSNLPAGIYFVSLYAGKSAGIAKMIISSGLP